MTASSATTGGGGGPLSNWCGVCPVTPSCSLAVQTDYLERRENAGIILFSYAMRQRAQSSPTIVSGSSRSARLKCSPPSHCHRGARCSVEDVPSQEEGIPKIICPSRRKILRYYKIIKTGMYTKNTGINSYKTGKTREVNAAPRGAPWGSVGAPWGPHGAPWGQQSMFNHRGPCFRENNQVCLKYHFQIPIPIPPKFNQKRAKYRYHTGKYPTLQPPASWGPGVFCNMRCKAPR